jgi:protein ImuB
VRGMARLFGSPRAMADEIRRDAASRGARVHVAMAGTQTAACLLARARPGVTVVLAGDEADAVALLPLASLGVLQTSDFDLHTFADAWRRWGMRTLGDLAKLPPADLVARQGRAALMWQALARGDDLRPLVPSLDEERFEGTFELEWPVEHLEPLSFVLTRLLEPLATRLERRDRGAAVLHVILRLITKEIYARRLELPSPMRDVRTLRTLALLDLESHPPSAAVDRVTVLIDPTPGRVLQHSLFSRALPTPEQLSTLLARVHAVMGQDRVGSPATVDTHRPDAFAMQPFKTDHEAGGAGRANPPYPPDQPHPPVVSAIRRCRQPVPARVVVEGGHPVRVTTDRRGFAGGTIVRCAGPWRSSGAWWADGAQPWDRDEWDIALSDGAVYRIFQNRDTEAWFIDAIVD